MAIYQAPSLEKDIPRQIRSFAAGSISSDIDLAARSGVMPTAASYASVHNNNAASQSVTLASEDGVDFTVVVGPNETIPIPGAVRFIRSAGIGADISVIAYWVLGPYAKNP